MSFITSLLLLTSISNLLSTTAASSPSSWPRSCTEELVAFAPCLSYVSESPNNMSDAASLDCCNDLYEAIQSGDGSCFCYLTEQPLIFGFPLNDSKVDSLPVACNSSSNWNGPSLLSFCSELPALPPLGSTGSSLDFNSADPPTSDGSAPPFPADSSGSSTISQPPSAITTPSVRSFATKLVIININTDCLLMVVLPFLPFLLTPLQLATVKCMMHGCL